MRAGVSVRIGIVQNPRCDGIIRRNGSILAALFGRGATYFTGLHHAVASRGLQHVPGCLPDALARGWRCGDLHAAARRISGHDWAPGTRPTPWSAAVAGGTLEPAFGRGVGVDFPGLDGDSAGGHTNDAADYRGLPDGARRAQEAGLLEPQPARSPAAFGNDCALAADSESDCLWQTDARLDDSAFGHAHTRTRTMVRSLYCCSVDHGDAGAGCGLSSRSGGHRKLACCGARRNRGHAAVVAGEFGFWSLRAQRALPRRLWRAGRGHRTDAVDAVNRDDHSDGRSLQRGG